MLCAFDNDAALNTTRHRGFSLIEVMVVVAIAAILVALALPNLASMSCRAKQSEIKVNIASIVRLLEAHRGETSGNYREIFDGCSRTKVSFGAPELGWESVGVSRYRYGYATEGNRFAVSAIGCGREMTGDMWVATTTAPTPSAMVDVCLQSSPGLPSSMDTTDLLLLLTVL